MTKEQKKTITKNILLEYTDPRPKHHGMSANEVAQKIVNALDTEEKREWVNECYTAECPHTEKVKDQNQKYTVCIHQTENFYTEVEAKDKDEAIEKAEDEFSYDGGKSTGDLTIHSEIISVIH